MQSIDVKLILLYLAVGAGLLSAALLVWIYAKHGPGALSRRGVFLALTPNLIAGALIVTLAAHMRISLGGWPQSIGEAGFPRLLLFHANVSMYYFLFLLFATIVMWPLAVIISTAVPGRAPLPYLALYFIAYWSTWGILQLMPPGFLYWWWD
ncbi:MAG: hypothetical protein ACR2IE_00555 [Candidatus Sumerlaeaceae bacterium]